MKMQTMRNLMGEPTSQTPSTSTGLLPPLTAFALGPVVRAQQPALVKDLAEKKAREAYAAIMAGVAFRAQLRLR